MNWHILVLDCWINNWQNSHRLTHHSPFCFVFLSQAFNKCKREGFRLQTVDKAPLAKRRKMKKTSTSTETRSSSSESTHSSSSSSQSQEKSCDTNPQPSNSTPVNTPVPLGTDSENQPAHPAFDFSEGQWGSERKKNGDSDSVMNSRMARTSVETALLFLSVPGSSLPLAQLHGRPQSLQNQACSRSSNCHLNINQIITSNSLSFLSLSLSHTDCINQGLDQEDVVTGVQNEKGCPTAPGPDRQWRDILSLIVNITAQPVFVHASRGFKGKVVVFTPWMLCIFMSKGERKCNVQQR